jgi:hypothetical protein
MQPTYKNTHFQPSRSFPILQILTNTHMFQFLFTGTEIT